VQLLILADNIDHARLDLVAFAAFVIEAMQI
jgi:hypothetical protein